MTNHAAAAGAVATGVIAPPKLRPPARRADRTPTAPRPDEHRGGTAWRKRRWLARTTWLVLLTITAAGGGLLAAPAPYLLHHPGAVIDATAEMAGGANDPTFGAGGRFLLTTLRSTPLNWGEYTWFSYRRPPAARLVRIPSSHPPRSHFLSVAAMEQSKEVATAVASCAIHGCTPEPVGVRVVRLRPGPAADAGLAAGDVIIQASPLPVPRAYVEIHLTSVDAILAALSAPEREVAGRQPLRLSVVRDGETVSLVVPRDAGPLGADLITAWVAERRLEVDTGDVGGASAGLMLTLTLVDAATAGDLAGGRRIAGTGTIAGDGGVGRIGGVDAKVAGAVRSDAEVFLVPDLNGADARAAAPRELRVVEVGSLGDALRWLCRTGGASSACQPPRPMWWRGPL